MFIKNLGPGVYDGSLTDQGPGTQGSMPLIIQVNETVEINEEMGERLLVDFEKSQLFRFEEIKEAKQQPLGESVKTKQVKTEKGK